MNERDRKEEEREKGKHVLQKIRKKHRIELMDRNREK